MEAAQLAALGRHLHAWLPEVMAGQAGLLEAKKLEGGQSNPTFLLDTPSGRRLVLRKKPGIVKVGWAAGRMDKSGLANSPGYPLI